ncbi:TonB-dependent receptor [Sphingomonas canadensis]|uniref:TonB-dependent receptor n=1 Tax=Sphingomonas canadensis TaxID=1219257 RepID=A0ABW3H8L7_9SPHN|nr:TonB-dependent receptor [Sphingomonas canadensis]MCW3836193.1 TonB-dependent receptor [Sphingomonas canadensis]
MPAAAQDAGQQPEAGPAEGEIVVTATRRSESVKNTPLSIAVESGENLARSNVSSLQDLTRVQPALAVNNQGADGNQYIIRGVLSDVGSTTGIYQNEAPLVGNGIVQRNGDGKPGLRLHDIERVEVLKGPQGTLFGSGSLSGTIRVITNKPSTDAIAGGGTVTAGFIRGGKALYTTDGYLNVPVTDKVAFRVVGWGEFGGGYIDQQTGFARTTQIGNANDSVVWGGRSAVSVDVTDGFNLLGEVSYQQVQVDGTQSFVASQGAYRSNAQTQEPYESKYLLATLTGTLDTGIGTVSLIGSYGRQSVLATADTTPSAAQVAGRANGRYCSGGATPPNGFTCPLSIGASLFSNDGDFHNYTAEARFASDFSGPLQLVAGAYYEYDVTGYQSTIIKVPASSGLAECYTISECTGIGNRNAVLFARTAEQTVSQFAFYGQADYEITDKLKASAGLRYYTAKLTQTDQQLQAGVTSLVNVIDPPGAISRGSSRENSPSYAFSLLYTPSSDVSIYARAASGFRIGGVNNSALLARDAGVTIADSYGPDDLWSYEIGSKFYLLDRRLFVDVAAYQMDWSGQQVSATDPSGRFTYVVNAAQSRIRGIELSARYSYGGFSLGTGLTYTDAVLTRDLPAAVRAAGTFGSAGDRLPRIPRWIGSAQARYETGLASGTGYIQGDVSVRGSSSYSFNDSNVFNPRLPSYGLIGAAAGYIVGPWDLGVFAENITNKPAYFGVNATVDAVKVYTVRPRTIGLRARASF